MNKQNIKLFLFFIIGLGTAFLAMHFLNTYKIEKKTTEGTEISTKNRGSSLQTKEPDLPENSGNIDELTAENLVVNYVKANKKLPEYYITKSEARKNGWVPSKGNLCDVLPGKAIGGDKFDNREKELSGNDQYYEADVNYRCGNRNADRIVFTKSGDVYLTKDHYKTFQKK